MKRALLAGTVLAFTTAPSLPRPARAETGSAMVVNPTEAKWAREAGDPPGAESVVLREDPQTGATELFARYRAGHVFRPHWHSANERIVLIEGRLSIGKGNSVKYLDPGGFAYLPAKQVQSMTCLSRSRCTFYVFWDGKLDFHRAAAD